MNTDNVIPLKKTEGFRTTDPLVSFLYSLLRDNLAAGEVEKLTIDAERYSEVVLSNTYLAEYATSIASRLQRK
jgi:hypothetical protein